MKKYVDPKTVVMKDLVQPGMKVHFSFYRDKEFWYEHDNGFAFPIALDEVEGPKCRATLLDEDKAIYFMRWMKKYIEAAKKEANEQPV